ncbi:MAG: zinc ABC transporter substrate-binding protein [Candidatus Thiodiazotropha sp. (ex Monitilora ramsayi)]|nr:zinc ABC transporter substrate-binding protein [Candidatus Thiodiazotropha sp. (ex Monitilora ramsayi)]
MFKLKLFLKYALCLLVLNLFSPLIQAEPKVVVSIKPIHSLIAGLMRDIGEPLLLIDDNQSPHNMSLRPSNARALNEADLIVWIGSSLEPSLSRLLDSHNHDAEVVSMIDTPGLLLLPMRVNHDWETHQHIEHHQKVNNHSASGTQTWDNHIWLSPDNAILMVRHLTQVLIRLDELHSEQYLKNSRSLINRLQALDRDLASRITAVHETPFIVFHDAYHYFEQHFQLNAVGSVSVSPERLSGARHIHDLRQKIRHLNARCVFTEPQFEPKLVRTLVDGTQVRIGQLDPLGQALPSGPDTYFTLMQRLSENLIECLTE